MQTTREGGGGQRKKEERIRKEEANAKKVRKVLGVVQRELKREAGQEGEKGRLCTRLKGFSLDFISHPITWTHAKKKERYPIGRARVDLPLPSRVVVDIAAAAALA